MKANDGGCSIGSDTGKNTSCRRTSKILDCLGFTAAKITVRPKQRVSPQRCDHADHHHTYVCKAWPSFRHKHCSLPQQPYHSASQQLPHAPLSHEGEVPTVHIQHRCGGRVRCCPWDASAARSDLCLRRLAPLQASSLTLSG